MGITLNDLYSNYDARTFINHLNGYWDHIATRHQNEWEVGRAFTWHLLNIQMDRKHQIKKVTDFMLFPWEENFKAKKQKQPMSAQQKEELKQLFN